MSVDASALLRTIESISAAMHLVSQLEGVAEGLAAAIGPAAQSDLKAKLAQLRADNDAARARRHARLVDAAGG